jgi:sec-independent protein translocase protein TatC
MAIRDRIPSRFPMNRPSLPALQRGNDNHEDVFVEMTLAEHLDEMRSRLVKTCIGVGLSFGVGLIFAPQLLELVRANAHVDRFDVIEATEPIVNYFKTALYIALCISFPLIFYQAFAFISPGLTRKEKRYIYGSLPFVVLFFLAGAGFAFFLAIPRAFAFLSGFQAELWDYSPRFSSIASFYIQVSLGLGFAFQLPIVMFLLARLHIVTPKKMAAVRKFAFVGVLIAAAIITPTPDPFNMLFVAMPIYALYELGLIFARIAGRRGNINTGEMLQED